MQFDLFPSQEMMNISHPGGVLSPALATVCNTEFLYRSPLYKHTVLLCANERTYCSESPRETNLPLVFDAFFSFDMPFLIALCTLDI